MPVPAAHVSVPVRHARGIPEEPIAAPPGAAGWFAAAACLLFAANAMSSRYLFSDSYYDLYAGRYILQHGLPHGNVFTAAAPGTAWVDQQWLAHVLYYLMWSGAGYRAVAALSALLVTSGFALLWLLMRRRGVPPARAFAWTLAAEVPCLGNTGIRAQSFAYPLLALTLWLILTDKPAPRMRRRTWLVLPILVVWANTHGTVLLGATVVVSYAVYRMAKARARREGWADPRYLMLAILSATSVVFTPYGLGVAGYYTRFAGNTALRHDVVEWAPPNPAYPITWGFFALVLAVAAVVVVAWHRGARPDPVLLVLAVFLLGLALTAIRNQAWFAFGGALLAADTLARSNSSRAPALGKVFRRVIVGSLAALGALCAGVLAITPVSQFQSLIPRHAIDRAAALAREHPKALILGDDKSSSPMLWLHPATLRRVGYDDRFEQYTTEQFTAYADFLNLRGQSWQRVADGYSIIVVSRQRRPLAAALAKLPGWRVVFEDASGVVLTRRARS